MRNHLNHFSLEYDSRQKEKREDVRHHSVQLGWCRVRQGEGAKDHKALGSGKAPQVVIKRNPYDGGKLLRIGTWNVRILNNAQGWEVRKLYERDGMGGH